MTCAFFRPVFLLFACAALAQPAVAQQDATAPPPTFQTPRAPNAGPAPQGFSVVLVLGDMDAATTPDNVPAAARKALADMKDFLPYKGYRLLDTHWTLCCGHAPLSGRLKGIDDQEYELRLDVGGVRNGQVNVRFILGESGSIGDSPSDTRAAAAEIERRIQQLRQQQSQNNDRAGSKHPDQQKLISEINALTAQLAGQRAREGQATGDSAALLRELRAHLAQLQRKRGDVEKQIEVGVASPNDRLAVQRDILEIEQQILTAEREAKLSQSMTWQGHTSQGAIIDASFTMSVGETVVVGTSRVKGDKALIALLTAVPAKPTAGRE